MAAATTGGGFEHDVLAYVDDAEFLAGTVPFVLDGLEAAERVMVAVGPASADALRSALRGDAGDVDFVDMEVVGRNPARIIPAWAAFLAEAEGAPVRGIGEPVWPGRSAAEIVECEHHEALLDVAFGDGPPWKLLCPYDSGRLPVDVVERAEALHHDRLVPERPLGDSLPAAPGHAVTLRFGDDLRAARVHTRSWAVTHGVAATVTEDLVLTSDELMANAVRHGEGGGRLRLWVDDGAVVAEVANRGVVVDPLVGRRQPALHQSGGRGLWIANALCDLVQLRSSAAGTVVRVRLEAA